MSFLQTQKPDQKADHATTSSCIVINLGVARLIYDGLNLFPPSPAAARAALIAVLDTAPIWDGNSATYPTTPDLYRQVDANGYTILVIK